MKESEKLLLKYIEGIATPEEQATVENWYADLETPDISGFTDLQKEQQLEIIRRKLPGDGAKKIKLWQRIAAVAAILIAVSTTVFYYNYYHSSVNQVTKVDYDYEIAPGKIGATLTLADGKQILLDDAAEGEIAQEAGVIVTKTEDGQLLYQIQENKAEENKSNTLSTVNGQTYMVTLPDRTKIWLNAASSLTYNSALYTNGQRKVELTGEAYFEVVKDKKHPFIVKTGDQEVEVLGTYFNINSYADEAAIRTTLLEGSVRVIKGQRREILRPGQQAVATSTGIVVKEVDLDEIVDWKEGDFSLNHINFKTAMRKIARWYDVEFVYDNTVPVDIEVGGWISRKNNLSAVLKLIESSGFAHFNVQGRKVYVSK